MESAQSKNKPKHFQMKNYLISLLMAAWAVISPSIPLLIAVGCLVIADFITAIIAANKNKISITSAKMRKSIPKIIVYNIAILSCVAMEYVVGSEIPMVKMCAAALALIEIKSIFENVEKFTGVNILSTMKKRFEKKENDDIFDLSDQIGSTGEKNKDKVSEK